MIAELPNGQYRAVHIPTAGTRGWPLTLGKKFDSYLAAKCWLIVMDDRHGTRGWSISCEIRTRNEAGEE